MEGQDASQRLAEPLHLGLLQLVAAPHARGSRADVLPLVFLSPLWNLLVCLHDGVFLGSAPAEECDDEETWRKHDQSADHAHVQRLQRDGDGAEADGRDLARRFILAFEEHAVGDHGQEEERHAARDALHAREVAARGAREDGDPEVLVAELLARRGREELFERDQVLDPSHRADPVHHPVILLHRQPAVAQEE